MSLPERLGRLRRVERIGAGGFATVWLYHDDELDSPVAVKALAENWAQRSDVRERFFEEARMLRRADSDHVVRIYDIGQHEQTPYLVMSYADRGTMAALTQDGPIAADRAVDLITQAADGIGLLHQRGIIHRDIKPENLLLRSADDGTDQVLVADLGVAKAVLHATGLTQVVGTPAYMAPEQAVGLGVDHRADIYALGAVAYRLMTGHYVREGGLAEVTATYRPRPPSEHVAELACYDAVLLRALEPNPEDRWEDAASFASALKSAATQTALSPSATLIAAQHRDTRPGRRRRRLFTSLGGLTILAIGAAIVVPQALPHNNSKPPPQTRPTPTMIPSITPAPDVRYPTLSTTLALTVKHTLIASTGAKWIYYVPAGWMASNPKTFALVAASQIDQQSSITWRPPHPPHLGGYAIQFEALNGVMSVSAARQQYLTELSSDTHARELKILPDRPDNGLWFTYVDGLDHLRYNFFNWLSTASGQAGLRFSVVGRKADAPGLEALLNRITQTAYPKS
ncbi:MAG TPA: serine/threonine-protein kinase [Marmoricola sp.]|nr:serine/threonine-protein kinase [Marmoricola sp.]